MNFILVNSVGKESSAPAINARARRKKKKERVNMVMLSSQRSAVNREASLMKVIWGCFNNAVNLFKQVADLIQFISAGKKELNRIRMVVKPVGNLRLTALGVSYLFMVEACLEVINMVATEGSAIAGDVEGGK